MRVYIERDRAPRMESTLLFKKTRSAGLVVAVVFASVLVAAASGASTLDDPASTPVGTQLELVEVAPSDDAELQSAALSLTATRAARVELDADTAVLGVTWEKDAIGPTEVQWRYLENGVWSQWSVLDQEAPTDRGERSGTEPIAVANVAAVDVVVSFDGMEVPGLAVHVVQSAAFETPENALAHDGGNPVTSMPELAATGAAPAVFDTGFQGLTITTRASWCAGLADCQKSKWEPEPATFKGAVVHHTAGNNTYTQGQVPQQIRNLWSWQADGLGWDDVGYNLIVDKFGGIWEGRDGGLLSEVAGGHAYKSNFDTFGITILGDYQLTPPPAVAREQMAKAIAWKLETLGISSATENITIRSERSDELTVPTVSAHRDIGFTDCPGNAFYPQMALIREDVQRFLTIASGNAVPVFRFWSPVSGSHFYTTDPAERDTVIKRWPREWQYEGEKFIAYSTEATHAVPVYRFWSPVYNAHFYTADAAEKATVEQRWPAIWKYEKIAFYAYEASFEGPNLNSVYRFWGPQSSSHFYTVSPTERDTVRKRWPTVWSYEGERFKVPAQR